MQIRAAVPADLAALEALFEEGDALHRERVPERFRAAERPARSSEYLLGLLGDATHAILVADDESKDALGFVHLALCDSPALPIFVPRRFVVVDTLVVAARARRRGIGRALMAAADTWARERGASELELTVYVANTEAEAFYRSLGYGAVNQRLARVLA
jgi:ribosomal protein S18 acetylase RimI-like enzyme